MFQLLFQFMHGTLHRIILPIAVAALAQIAVGCTPSGEPSLSEGYQAPMSGTPVDQTESLRSQHRDWAR